MGKKQKETCSCPICSNEVREERQYAAFKLKNGEFVIVDAEEVWHIDEFMKNRTEKTKQPDYPLIEPEDEDVLQLAYGVLIPQYDTETENWSKELDRFKNYAFATLEDRKVYLSAYSDYKIFPEMPVYNSHIPCALLLSTSLNLGEEKEFGFGYTLFLKYGNMEILDNIFNRDFVFCLGDIEETFQPDDFSNWTKYINKEKMMNVAKRLF